jgi:hypothetical protein
MHSTGQIVYLQTVVKALASRRNYRSSYTGNLEERERDGWKEVEEEEVKRRVSVLELGKMAIRGNRTVQEQHRRRRTLYITGL